MARDSSKHKQQEGSSSEEASEGSSSSPPSSPKKRAHRPRRKASVQYCGSWPPGLPFAGNQLANGSYMLNFQAPGFQEDAPPRMVGFHTGAHHPGSPIPASQQPIPAASHAAAPGQPDYGSGECARLVPSPLPSSQVLHLCHPCPPLPQPLYPCHQPAPECFVQSPQAGAYHTTCQFLPCQSPTAPQPDYCDPGYGAHQYQPGFLHGCAPTLVTVPPQPQQVGTAFPPSAPLIPLPIQLRYCPPPQPQLQPHSQVMYDATSGVVLCVGSAETAHILHDLSAAGHVLQPAHVAACQLVGQLQRAINNQIHAQRTRLLQQQARVSLRASEVQAAVSLTTNKIHALAGEMTERLQAAGNKKMSELRAQHSQFGSDVDTLHRLIHQVQQLCEGCEPLDVFLHKCTVMLQECTRLASKDVAEAVCTSADDLPDEARAHAEMARANDTLKQLLGVKDVMIWQLLQEREELQKQAAQLSAMFNSELEAVDKQCSELRQQLLILQDGVRPDTAAGADQGPGEGADAAYQD